MSAPTAFLEHEPVPASAVLARRHRRPGINITPPERAGRVLLGLGAVAIGGFLLASAATVIGVVLEVLLVAAGLDLVVTGGLGHCPLYARLGDVPASLRRRA